MLVYQRVILLFPHQSFPIKKNAIILPNLVPFYAQNSMDWFKGKSEPETIDFPIKYGAFLYMFP